MKNSLQQEHGNADCEYDQEKIPCVEWLGIDVCVHVGRGKAWLSLCYICLTACTDIVWISLISCFPAEGVLFRGQAAAFPRERQGLPGTGRGHDLPKSTQQPIPGAQGAVPICSGSGHAQEHHWVPQHTQSWGSREWVWPEEIPAPGWGMCWHLGCSPCTCAAVTLMVPSCCIRTQANHSHQPWEPFFTLNITHELVPHPSALEKSWISFLAAVTCGHSQDERDRPVT